MQRNLSQTIFTLYPR